MVAMVDHPVAAPVRGGPLAHVVGSIVTNPSTTVARIDAGIAVR
jgi:hypothetical protein